MEEAMETEISGVPREECSSVCSSATGFSIQADDNVPDKHKESDNVPTSWDYVEIESNIFHGDLETLLFVQVEEQCSCPAGTDKCFSDVCPNRAMFVECPPSCGNSCRNRRIQKREWLSGLQRIMTENKGFGIFTTKRINEGDFIAEYVGEILTTQEFQNKLETIYRNDKHYYSFDIGCGLVIDGHRFGNEIRFVNHSCEPNCIMIKWLVNGLPRLALFAGKDIQPGEELSYDYHFTLFQSEGAQRCLCGSQNCRGVIGVPAVKQRDNEMTMDLQDSEKKVSVNKLIQWSQGTIKPIPKKDRNIVNLKQYFLLKNYKQVYENRKNSETNYGNGDKLEKLMRPWIARYKPGSSRNHPLQIPEDDPKFTVLARKSELLYEFYVKLTMVKGEDGTALFKPIVNLPITTTTTPQPSSSKVTLDFTETVRTIIRGEFQSISSFEEDMRKVFNSSDKFHPEMSNNLLKINELFKELKTEAKKRFGESEEYISFFSMKTL